MNGTNYQVPHCGAFSTPHSHPSWAQIFASGSCFQIPLAFIISLMQGTMFHNHIAQLAILLLLYILIFRFLKSRRQEFIMLCCLTYKISSIECKISKFPVHIKLTKIIRFEKLRRESYEIFKHNTFRILSVNHIFLSTWLAALDSDSS